jgi:hypothetical protein
MFHGHITVDIKLALYAFEGGKFVFKLIKSFNEKRLRNYLLILEAQELKEDIKDKTSPPSASSGLSDLKTYTEGQLRFIATFSKKGMPLVGKWVNLMIYGSDGIRIESLKKKTNSEGKAIFDLTFTKSGNYKVQANAKT